MSCHRGSRKCPCGSLHGRASPRSTFHVIKGDETDASTKTSLQLKHGDQSGGISCCASFMGGNPHSSTEEPCEVEAHMCKVEAFYPKEHLSSPLLPRDLLHTQDSME